MICSICKIEKEKIEFYQKQKYCKECNKTKAKRWTKEHPERILEIRRKHYAKVKDTEEHKALIKQNYAENIETVKLKNAAFYIKHREEVIARVKASQQEDVVAYRRKQRLYKKQNPHISAASRAKRLQRFVQGEDEDELRLFYLHCPEGHEVDHIIPLCGRLVSGLHVLANLQYLPIKENRSKGNKFIV